MVREQVWRWRIQPSTDGATADYGLAACVDFLYRRGDGRRCLHCDDSLALSKSVECICGLGLEDDFDGAVVLFLEDVVGVRCVGERQGVGGEGVDAEGVVVGEASRVSCTPRYV